MSTLRIPTVCRTVLLLVTLAACADDPLTPAPPDTPPDRPAHASLATTAAPALVPFARIDAARTSALASWTGPCTNYSTDEGEYRLTLTPQHFAAIRSAWAAGLRVRVWWETEALHSLGGYVKVSEIGRLEHAGASVYEESFASQFRAPGTPGVTTVRYYSRDLTEADDLVVGSVLSVRLAARIYVTVPVYDCGRNVKGAFGRWLTYSQPVLSITY